MKLNFYDRKERERSDYLTENFHFYFVVRVSIFYVTPRTISVLRKRRYYLCLLACLLPTNANRSRRKSRSTMGRRPRNSILTLSRIVLIVYLIIHRVSRVRFCDFNPRFTSSRNRANHYARSFLCGIYAAEIANS